MAVLIFISHRIKIANSRTCNYVPFNLLDDSIRLYLYQQSYELPLRSLHDAPKINKRFNPQVDSDRDTENHNRFLSARKEGGFSNRLRNDLSKGNVYKSHNDNSKKDPFKYSKLHESSKFSYSAPRTANPSKLQEENENDDVNPLDNLSDNLIYTEDPDSFGILSRSNEQFTRDYDHDEDDKKEEEFLQNTPLHMQKLSTKKYADMIKDHIQHNRIKEALDVLEQRMIKEDRVKPENYIFNLLIGGCARVGYTKKAFKLFNDLKKRGLKVTGGTFTSLFNACANSPWHEDGLQRANNLRLLMQEKGQEPNLTNYNAMIKAFGRCGDLQTAFGIVDEMVSKKIPIRVHTFNFLLQACISDKKNGFQHALVVWRKMLTMKEKPNIYSFNLMLKCVKECKFGNTDDDLNTLKSLCLPNDKENIQQLPESSDMNQHNLINTSSGSEANISKNQPTLQVASPTMRHLNLLSKTPDTSNLVSIKKINTVDDRMLIVGGYLGFLQEMNAWNIKPDIKCLTQLLLVSPNTTEAENKLLEIKEFLKMNVDIDFYNTLIKKRCYRFDYDSAKEVKKLIEEENIKQVKQTYWKSKTMLSPNIMTYGLMALYCVKKSDAQDLLNEMGSARFRVNSEILGTLLRHGTASYDFDYILYIMDYTKTEQVEINQVYFSHLDNFYIKCKSVLRGEQLLNESPPSASFETAFKKFKREFKKFAKTEKPAEEHPWSQFRENQPETFQRPTVIPKPIRFYKRAPRRIPKYVVKV